MREGAVLVELEQPVDALPDKVWELVGDTAALSAMPGRFAFSVPAAVAGTDRMSCLLVPAESGCTVLDVREEVPGQMICWQALNTQPAGEQAFTLSVHPRRGESAVRIAVSHVVPGTAKSQYEQYWHSCAETWVARLKAIAESRAPWPQAGMPADMQRACSALPRLKRPAHVSAAVLVNAESGTVWEAVWAPESVHLIDPGHVAYGGRVPGTPEREIGEMQYGVLRHPSGRFTAAVHVVRELTEGRSAVIQNVRQPHDEVFHQIGRAHV